MMFNNPGLTAAIPRDARSLPDRRRVYGGSGGIVQYLPLLDKVNEVGQTS